MSSRRRSVALLDPPGVLLGASWSLREPLTSLLKPPGSLLEPKNHRRMLQKPYFLQGKTKILGHAAGVRSAVDLAVDLART